MTYVNKKQIPKELQERAWKRFDAEKFLTPSERILIWKRLAIAVLLEEGLIYRRIGEMLNVTRVTISFVKHKLKRAPRISVKRG